MTRTRNAAAVAAVILAAGCGGKDPHGRLPVSGKVTFKGSPLENGQILFVGEQGMRTAAHVRAGKYAIPQEQGLTPGTYKAVISSGDPTKLISVGKGQQRDTVSEERIPPQYNTQTKLTAEVKDGTANTFDYDIP